MSVRKVSAISSGLTTSVTAYTSGDVVGNRFTFDPALDFPNAAALIRNIVITDKSGVLAACELWIYGQNVTQANMVDNSPPAIVDAESTFLVARAVFAATDSTILAANGFLTYTGKDLLVTPQTSAAVPAPTGLSAHLITKSANTFFVAATDIQIDLYVQTGLGLGIN